MIAISNAAEIAVLDQRATRRIVTDRDNQHVTDNGPPQPFMIARFSHHDCEWPVHIVQR
jgi:hypothetical protein